MSGSQSALREVIVPVGAAPPGFAATVNPTGLSPAGGIVVVIMIHGTSDCSVHREAFCVGPPHVMDRLLMAVVLTGMDAVIRALWGLRICLCRSMGVWTSTPGNPRWSLEYWKFVATSLLGMVAATLGTMEAPPRFMAGSRPASQFEVLRTQGYRCNWWASSSSTQQRVTARPVVSTTNTIVGVGELDEH